MWRLPVGQVSFFYFCISSRHRGGAAPWWQENKTVSRWRGSERTLVPRLWGLETGMIALPRRSPTAGCWCLSRQWTAGGCHRAGRRRWWRGCCGHCTRGSEPEMWASSFNISLSNGDASFILNCVYNIGLWPPLHITTVWNMYRLNFCLRSSFSLKPQEIIVGILSIWLPAGYNSLLHNCKYQLCFDPSGSCAFLYKLKVLCQSDFPVSRCVSLHAIALKGNLT